MNTAGLNERRIPRVAARTRLSETAAAIGRIILDGTLPSGSHVKDQDLAQQLGVSRATVREAVRQLVHDGLLEHEPYKGLTVASLDDETVIHIAEVRATLETLAAQRLARAMSASMKQQLRAALDELGAAVNSTDIPRANQAHIAFHRLIVTLSGNPILANSWAALELRARLELRLDLETLPGFERLATQHRASLEVIEGGDPARIAEHFSSHVLHNARDVVRVRRESPTPSGVIAGVNGIPPAEPRPTA